MFKTWKTLSTGLRRRVVMHVLAMPLLWATILAWGGFCLRTLPLTTLTVCAVTGLTMAFTQEPLQRDWEEIRDLLVKELVEASDAS